MRFIFQPAIAIVAVTASPGADYLLVHGTGPPNIAEECPAPRGTGDRRPSKKTLTFMHWNVEWLFRGGVDYGPHPSPGLECPGECEWENSEQARKHLDAVKEYIASVKADIFSLNEVQDCTILDIISRFTNASDSPYLAWGADTYTGQNVGMISNIDPDDDLELMTEREDYPISGSQCEFSGKPKTRAPTKNYITTFQHIEGLSKPLTLIAAHLLARPTDPERCAEREASATVLANRAQDALTKGHHVIIAGDLNDFDRLNPDHDNSMPTSTVLEVLRLNGKMRSATEKLPQEKRFTCDSEEFGKQSLDHVLMDTELYGLIKSVAIKHPANEGEPLSDHFPIVVRFDLDGNGNTMLV